MGSLLALNKFNNLNPNISSFFSALFYFIFSSKFFSFIKKKFYKKKVPIHPDGLHLHVKLL